MTIMGVYRSYAGEVQEDGRVLIRFCDTLNPDKMLTVILEKGSRWPLGSQIEIAGFGVAEHEA